MNIVFMGTPDFAVPALEKLHNEGHSIELVITQPDKPKGRGKKLLPTPVKSKGVELGLEIYQPMNINTPESFEKISNINPDVIVVVAYGQILKENILNIPKYGCVNIHASLLPKYRGAAPINWAIINGEKESGITTMIMEKGLDSGDMLLKEKILIPEDMTAGELHDELMNIGAELIIKTLDGLENNTIIPEKQNHDLSTYAPMMDKTLGEIDWDINKEDIKNLVRGTNPWPVAYSYYDGNKFKIYKVDTLNETFSGTKGEIVKVQDEGIYVKVSNGVIIIEEIQFPGKKRMKVKDFLKGNTIEIGKKLSK
ncbi:methionyl-tRNA formyltransferase [Clostridium sp. D2Q-11]|uniref:Methionyl-tRNA formyltransferase n=1 Tax=Anaeromonas frigoriresistens TaxID=2683708 RepID=A0A942Z7N1_9FIRM|nr:methionyl-tRNA formyltransferase [Anaeromonas frigoriresistens]MBS4539736.1 methionyl-tRNA formyltransferase [Anaeromonas frigoriresistens]